MVQCLSELYGVYQGIAFDIGFVVFDQIRTCKHEGSYLPVVKFDFGQITAHAQVKCPPEDIRGL